MTRKDYVKIAAALSHARPEGNKREREQWQRDIRYIAMALQNDNPRFDRQRFAKACGYYESGDFGYDYNEVLAYRASHPDE